MTRPLKSKKGVTGLLDGGLPPPQPAHHAWFCGPPAHLPPRPSRLWSWSRVGGALPQVTTTSLAGGPGSRGLDVPTSRSHRATLPELPDWVPRAGVQVSLEAPVPGSGVPPAQSLGFSSGPGPQLQGGGTAPQSSWPLRAQHPPAVCVAGTFLGAPGSRTHPLGFNQQPEGGWLLAAQPGL